MTPPWAQSLPASEPVAPLPPGAPAASSAGISDKEIQNEVDNLLKAYKRIQRIWRAAVRRRWDRREIRRQALEAGTLRTQIYMHLTEGLTRWRLLRKWRALAQPRPQMALEPSQPPPATERL